MITPGFGYVPDAPEDIERDGRLRHVSGLVGSNPAYATERDWETSLDYVPGQGGTNRCVAWSFSSAMFCAGRVGGRPIKRPSAKWLYDLARYWDTPGVLVDAGSRGRSMALAAQRHGVVSEERLPSTDANVNEPPPFDADLAGADALFTGHYKLDGDFPTLARMALDKGHFPCVAFVLHESFLGWKTTDVYDVPEGNEVGRHMMMAIGYRPGAIKYVNSWTVGWGFNGCIWISDNYHRGPHRLDGYVVTSAPNLR